MDNFQFLLQSHARTMEFIEKARKCAAEYPEDHPFWWWPPIEPIIPYDSQDSPPSSPLSSPPTPQHSHQLLEYLEQKPLANDPSSFHHFSNLSHPYQFVEYIEQNPFANDPSSFHYFSSLSHSVDVGLRFEPMSLNQVLTTPSIDAPIETGSSSETFYQDWNISLPTEVSNLEPRSGYHDHHTVVDGHKKEDNMEVLEAQEDDAANVYKCRICFEMAKQPGVTPCGHLFCWPCLCLRLYMPSNECPACRGGILEHEIVPIDSLALSRNPCF